MFQDPAESLNSRHTVGRILEEPFIIHGKKGNAEQRRTWVQELLEKVGLPGSAVDRYPMSSLAASASASASLAPSPSSPSCWCVTRRCRRDVSVQSQIVNLLLQSAAGDELAIIFIAHDLSVVKHISDRIAVMYLADRRAGRRPRLLYLAPRHPYTQALISAIPVPDPRRRSQRILLTGMCRPHLAAEWLPFSPALPHATDLCCTCSPALEACGGQGIR